MKPTLAAGCIAEFMGAFALCFLGAGAIILTSPATGGAGSLITIALAHGLALFVFISGTMYISGGQLNPAVSIGLMSIGKQTPGKTAAFVLSQLIGAACAAGVWQLALGKAVANSDAVKLGATIGKLTTEGNAGGVFILEALMTFALMFVVLSAVVDERAHKLGGLPIGMTVAAGIMAAGPLTGASMNPSRTFGPAICGNHWDMHWVYWVAPVTGAVLAAFIYKTFWRPSAAA